VPSKKKAAAKNGTSANLGFEQKLWAATDKMCGHMDAAEYKHVALGLIFFKDISNAFEERNAGLLKGENADPEDPERGHPRNVLGAQRGALALPPEEPPNRSASAG